MENKSERKRDRKKKQLQEATAAALDSSEYPKTGWKTLVVSLKFIIA